MLEVSGLQSSYGQSQVLFDVSLAVGKGEVATLLGRNGMGKTTTIRTIMGLNRPKGGRVIFEGADVTGLSPDKIARRGIGLVPEGRQVFPTLTVRENLIATAANRLARPNPWTMARVIELFPRLGERQEQLARTLSGGELQMLAIGRGLMTNPQLLIPAQATAGHAPVIRAEIWACLARLKAEGQSILIVDKNLAVLKRFADHHACVEKGRTVWTGSSADMERDADIVHRYVGV